MSVNDHTVSDIFSFTEDLHEMEIDEHDILVSYNVSSLFTNLSVDETIEILAEKAFKGDWFSMEYDLNITKTDLIELLKVAMKNQLFQFQVDGVAMGSSLGLLMANAFVCNIEEQLTNQNKMPAFHDRYVDDTLGRMPDASSASEFLSTLNVIHPSVSFTTELEDNSKLPFLGMVIIRNGSRLDTKVYRKPTNTGNAVRHQLSDLSHKIDADVPLFTKVMRSRTKSNQRNINLQLSISKTLFIISSVVCAMQTMLASRVDTYNNVWRNTSDQQLATM